MKWKPKKLLSVILIFSLVLSVCIPDDMGIAFANEDVTAVPFTYTGVDYQINLAASSDGADTLSMTLQILDTNDKSEISLPSYNTIAEHLSDTQKSQVEPCILLSTDKGTTAELADITTIEIASGDYSTIPAELFSSNKSIKNIIITSNAQLTFEEGCFSNMSALNYVKVSVKELILKGRVFQNCSQLTTLDLNSTETAQVNGGSNFDGCSGLKKLNFDCPVNFGGSSDFSYNTFSKTSKQTSYVNFQQKVTNTSSIVFSNINSDCHLTISFYGEDNELSNHFIYNSAIQDLNITKKNGSSGSMHFKETAIHDSNIENFTINAPTSFDSQALNYTSSNTNVITNMTFNSQVNFSNKSFCNVTIKNLTVNVENTQNSQALTYDTSSSRLGYDTKVNNLYFDTINSDGIANACTELRDFPLGNTYHSSLNIDCIYFLNPNFKYIGGSDYKRCDNNGVTTVYGYGGAVATDESGKYITGYDMYKSWTKDANCVYKNYVDNAETLDYTIDTVVYLSEGKDTYSYDFSSANNISAYATYLHNETPYKDVNVALKENGRYPLTLTTNDAVSSNFNYRILQLNTSEDLSASKQYVYTDTNGKTYTSLTTPTLELTEGVHEFLLEAGGVKHSFKINVRRNQIDHIESITPTEGNALYLNIGDTLTKDMIDVNVCYANQTHAKLSNDEYEIINPEITDTKNEIIIQLQISSTETIQETITVYGYSQDATGFEVICSKKTLPENSTLSVSDVELHNITFANPNATPISVVTKGFHFVVDEKEVDEVSIKQGTNKISVSYMNYVYEDAISITGTEPTVSKVIATYIGKGVYENCSIPSDTNNLWVYIYMDNNADTPILVTDTSKISFGEYQIVANQRNSVSVYYNGIKAEEDILVSGLKDSVAELSSAQYIGETSIGTSLDAKNFYIELTLLSGKKLNSSTNPELLDHLTFSSEKLTDTVNIVNITYNGQYTKTITIFAYASSTTPVSPTPPVVTNTPIVTTTPTVTPLPTEDISISDTSVPLASGNTPSDANSTMPVSTTVPTTTATPVPTDLASTVKKGNTYVINNIKYTILSINGTSGTASIVGYVKSAKAISIKPSIKIRNCTFSIVSIKKNAFKNCLALKGSVKLTRSISTVGDNAFYGCNNITSVTIGSNLKKLGAKCFYNCRKLKKVDLTNASKLSKVGRAAFKNNASSRVFKISKGTKKYFAKLLKGKY